jgi:hypothetical protein
VVLAAGMEDEPWAVPKKRMICGIQVLLLLDGETACKMTSAGQLMSATLLAKKKRSTAGANNHEARERRKTQNTSDGCDCTILFNGDKLAWKFDTLRRTSPAAR